jgi:hypothetical protein
MTNEASRSNFNHKDLMEQDLFNALLKADGVLSEDHTRWNSMDDSKVLEDPKSKITYPWNPAEAEADEFFNSLEQEFELNLSDQEVAQRSQVFFNHIDQLFSATTLQTSLAHKFSSVPQALLNAIARQAQHVAQTSVALADQLVQCVQDVLPEWAEDDLQVLARPLAYAMRGDDLNAVDSTINSIRPGTWDDLSETEQARMSLAIARYALGKIEGGAKK